MPRFTLRRMMAIVAVVALALIRPQIATVVLLLVAAVFAIRSRGWAVPYFVTLACLYLPFAWLLDDMPWDGYRRYWIGLWPILPGLIAGMAAHPNQQAMVMASGTATLGLVALFTRAGRSGRTALVVANGIALVGAALTSWVAYQLYRS